MLVRKAQGVADFVQGDIQAAGPGQIGVLRVEIQGGLVGRITIDHFTADVRPMAVAGLKADADLRLAEIFRLP